MVLSNDERELLRLVAQAAALSQDTRSGAVFVCGRCEVDQFLDADESIREAVAYGPFFREVPEEAVLGSRERAANAVAGQRRPTNTSLRRPASATFGLLGRAVVASYRRLAGR